MYYWIWYKVISKVTRKGRKGEGLLEEYGNHFLLKIKLANLFGGFDAVWCGDSNVERGDKYFMMKRFGKYRVINLSKGGSKASDWLKFFLFNPVGKKVYALIRDRLTIFGLSGNDILQRTMSDLPSNIRHLHSLFPVSACSNVPQINSEVLAELAKHVPIWEHWTASDYNDAVKAHNIIIKKEFGQLAIDVYSLFLDKNSQKAYWFVLQDIVHYSKYAIKVFTPLMNAIITIIAKLKV